MLLRGPDGQQFGPNEIRLNHVVRGIDYNRRNGSAVRVTTNQGDFDADAAVVTLTLGVLKDGAVAFDPPLPSAKEAAIRRVGMGSLTKIIAWFDEPFWDRDQYAFGYHRDSMTAGYPTTVVNLWPTHRKSVLVTMIGGPAHRSPEGERGLLSGPWQGNEDPRVDVRSGGG